MNNEVKDRDIENHTCYFFNDIFKVRHFDSSNIKRDEKSKKYSYLLHWICVDKRFEMRKIL